MSRFWQKWNLYIEHIHISNFPSNVTFQEHFYIVKTIVPIELYKCLFCLCVCVCAAVNAVDITTLFINYFAPTFSAHVFNTLLCDFT